MSFAFPIALTLAALALPIIALYILKVRLRRLPVSTNLFWKQVYKEKPPRALWQHFRNLTSLLLQLALLLLLVVAVADPYFSTQVLQARRLVIVIDNSASMRANDVVPTRLDAAKMAALEIVDGLRFRDEMSIVLAGNTPEVVIGMTGHPPTLRDAINEITFSDMPTSLRPAIELGQRLIGSHPNGKVIVMTDGAVQPEDLPVTPTESNTGVASDVSLVEFRLFSTEAANVGITQLQVRRSFGDPLGYEILVAVRNASGRAANCQLEVTLNHVPVDVIPLKLAAEERWSRSIEKTSLEGGRIHVQLTQITTVKPGETGQTSGTVPSPDLLSTDNSAWALLPDRKVQPVLLVSSGNLFLQKVFEANPLVNLTVRKDFPEEWPTEALIVLHGAVPEILPPNDLLVVDPIGNCDLWDVGEVIENPIVTEQDSTSSLMAYIRLDNVVIPELKSLKFRTPPHALAKSLSGDPVYAEVRRPTGKCLVLAVSLEKSDLAFRTVFPIMMANSLSWFAGTAGDLQPSLSAGSISTLGVSEQFRVNANELFLESPGGKRRAILRTNPASGLSLTPSLSRTEPTIMEVSDDRMRDLTERIPIGPLDEVGVWILTQQASDTARDRSLNEMSELSLAEVAVNLASERETDLRPLPQLLASPQTSSASPAWFSRPLWFYLILIACCLTSFEWILYQRRLVS